jgi:hypothetical protein
MRLFFSPVDADLDMCVFDFLIWRRWFPFTDFVMQVRMGYLGIKRVSSFSIVRLVVVMTSHPDCIALLLGTLRE